jgi:CspA family cold shock protein
MRAHTGFGFIPSEGGGKDVFVHVTAVQRRAFAALMKASRCSSIESDKRGPKAVNLKLVQAEVN